ncbi:hypothetical protein [Acidiphilium sp.]|uniref:hypothetical protein n=1 Tax=Acidiphilium sp. TaxID=527 RepID=UPI003D0625CF
MSGTNPQIVQGTLNRVRTHIVVPNYPALNVTASYMGKSQAVLSFEGPFVHQEETATGVVNSPAPFVMGRLVVSLLRTQGLANAYVSQLQSQAIIGPVTSHADTSAFSAITLQNSSIIDFDPGAFDGMDPVARVTIRGVFYTNSVLWTLV